MKWFATCQDVKEVKNLYRDLAKQYHPDLGGSTEIMQEINTEYAFAVAKLLKGENLTTEEINEQIKLSEAYRDALNKIIHLPGITIELVGAWIWVTGNTYPVRAEIKAAGYLFAPKKQAWYFRTEEFKVQSRKRLSLDQIRAKYGSKELNQDTRKNYIAA